ncbi:SRPBCC domain-containing protein [soil metagenome]
MAVNMKPTERQTRGLVIDRVIDAPREQVFSAWTEPQQVMRWWAPRNFVTTFCAIDLRPRGRWSVCMHSPEGIEYWTRGLYRKVCKPEMLVLSFTWQESSVHPPIETVVSLNFADEGEKTRFTFEQTFVETE